MNNGLSRIRALFSRARDRVIVVSAYVGANTLDQLLDSVPQAVPRTAVFARWDFQDIASGATDWRAWDVASNRGVPFYACPDLHAKIYVADDKALVGSANATASGMGVGGPGNVELLMPVDTTQPDVSRILAITERCSIEAMPVGADTANDQDVGSSDGIPIWIPEASPETFLDAFHGRTTHTDETLRICTALRLPEQSCRQALLRDALRETTTFRVAKHEFDTRPVLMTVGQLRDLLSERVDSRLGSVPLERLSLLVQWLGYFGANTHLGASAHGMTPALHAGERLTTYKIKDKSR